MQVYPVFHSGLHLVWKGLIKISVISQINATKTSFASRTNELAHAAYSLCFDSRDIEVLIACEFICYFQVVLPWLRCSWNKWQLIKFRNKGSLSLIGRVVASDTKHLLLASDVVHPTFVWTFLLTFFKMGQPRRLFWLFSIFSNKHRYNLYNKSMWKNIHPVYGTGIRTHDLRYMSRHP